MEYFSEKERRLQMIELIKDDASRRLKSYNAT
jgi:hypothetical protein